MLVGYPSAPLSNEPQYPKALNEAWLTPTAFMVPWHPLGPPISCRKLGAFAGGVIGFFGGALIVQEFLPESELMEPGLGGAMGSSFGYKYGDLLLGHSGLCQPSQ